MGLFSKLFGLPTEEAQHEAPAPATPSASAASGSIRLISHCTSKGDDNMPTGYAVKFNSETGFSIEKIELPKHTT